MKHENLATLKFSNDLLTKCIKEKWWTDEKVSFPGTVIKKKNYQLSKWVFLTEPKVSQNMGKNITHCILQGKMILWWQLFMSSMTQWINHTQGVCPIGPRKEDLWDPWGPQEEGAGSSRRGLGLLFPIDALRLDPTLSSKGCSTLLWRALAGPLATKPWGGSAPLGRPEARVIYACDPVLPSGPCPRQGARRDTNQGLLDHQAELLLLSSHRLPLYPPLLSSTSWAEPLLISGSDAVVVCVPPLIIQTAWLVWSWLRAWGEGWRREPGLERRGGIKSELPYPRLGLRGPPSVALLGQGRDLGRLWGQPPALSQGPPAASSEGSSSIAWMVAHQELGHSV